MSKAEQLRKRLVKVQEQILREEVEETTGSTAKLVMTGGLTVEDYPPIQCPLCGEEVDATEGKLDIRGNKWIYFEGSCPACDTDFRIGEVPHRCALCHEPLPCDPYYDVNELYHHRCQKDEHYYCTPCFMQLFFDGYIDLSSDDPDPGDRMSWYTHAGYSVAPYHSRLVANGYQEVAVVKEQDEIKEVCRQIVNEGGRYLILSLSSEEPQRKPYYVIYRRQT